MTEALLVTAILPSYNGGSYLPEAIESARRQTYRPIEILVVDDGSTDGTAAAANSYPGVRCLSLPRNQGSAEARNQGIAAAAGSFIAFLDSDDLWMPDKIERQMALFNGDPALDVVFTGVEQFHSPELTEAERRAFPLPAGAGGKCPSSLLAKRTAFAVTGPFCSTWRVGEFIDWYARAMEHGLREAELPDALVRRRVHKDNLTLRARNAKTDYVHILKASLDRRRNSPLSGPFDNMDG
jgi:glycosyltransferase involved in cell wall biosynthesis